MKKFILIILAFGIAMAFAQKDSVSVDLNKTLEKRYTYSTDTIPPAINFYISHFTIADLLILPAFGAFLFDFTLEKRKFLQWFIDIQSDYFYAFLGHSR